jgi:sugar phosphate isomerase/epimerase
MRYTRRDFGRLALAGLPASLLAANIPLAARAKINARIHGVTIGAITYSFRVIPDPVDIIRAYTAIGLGEMELMSNHAEALAGAPGGKALAEWRVAATAATFKPVRAKIADAGIDLRLLCYNMNVNTTKDADIEYGFMMAKWLDVDAISTSTQVSMAKRIAPFANKHKMMVGFHGHANTANPDEVAGPETFAAVMAESKYHGANLDIGHYTQAGYDPVAFIQQHHARITNLHLKDKKKASRGGANGPWGTGDTPIKEVLKLVQKNKYKFPCNIEFEYDGDPVTEVGKCLQICKDTLA